jgi:hypothetical protein
MWTDLSSQIAEQFAQFPGTLDVSDALTIRGPELLGRHRCEGFLDLVAGIAGEREEWTMPALLAALRLPYDRTNVVRIGLALRVLGGWVVRRKHGGARVYKRLSN